MERVIMKKVLFLSVMLASSAFAEKPVTGLISMDDYPREAMDRHEEGTVKVKLLISAEGRVYGCIILKSATQTLDAATCSVLMRRAVFKPATDETGKPKESDYTATITWKLPYLHENKNNNSTRMQN
jgi:protein TonB